MLSATPNPTRLDKRAARHTGHEQRRAGQRLNRLLSRTDD
jgi:hypothetical protein